MKRQFPTKSFLQAHIDGGTSIAALAEICDISPSKLKLALDDMGIARRRGPACKLPPHDELVCRLRAGERPVDIARECNVSRVAVGVALKRRGTIAGTLSTTSKPRA